ncbi:hypothetical protein OTU49_016249 [Cherax quadricarinatus]|uniref:Protein kinase domain-containing protein n=1 Tax=Cherax quadricarinatus TaxID=27406 RepID=A0AAW0YCH0_CHEQU
MDWFKTRSRRLREKYVDSRWILENEKHLKIKDLGYGGCGKTQLWNLPGHDTPVVLKNIFDPNTRETDCLREAQILEKLNGAGGAPRLLGLSPEIGCYFMSFLGLMDLETLSHNQETGREKLDDLFWLKAIESIIKNLINIHKKCIVHLDLKQNNVMVDRTDPKCPKTSIIDFGLSTRPGQPWVYGDYEKNRIDKFLEFSPWTCYEAAMGQPVTTKSDVVGVALLIKQVIGIMDRKPHQLMTMALKGLSRDPKERPGLKKYLRTTQKIIKFFTAKFG